MGTVNGAPDLRSVQFAQSANGKYSMEFFLGPDELNGHTGTQYTLEANKEVILSAGAVQSPHIRESLLSMNIPLSS